MNIILILCLSLSSFAAEYDSLGAYIKIEDRHKESSEKFCLEADKLFSGKSEAPVGTIARAPTRIKNIEALRSCGYIAARGQVLKREQYKKLYENIGCNWGCNGPKSFNLPQFSPAFFRGR